MLLGEKTISPDSKEVREWISNKMPELVEDLKRICRIKSVADLKEPDCLPYGKGCRDVLHEMLLIGEERGFETHNYDNYVGRITYPGKKKENVGIWAHLDVVEEGEGWQYPPYEPVLKDNYFIARGCQDNKSSAVMGLYALQYMKEHGMEPCHTFEVYLGTCEEQGMYDLDYFLEHYTAPTLSLVPDSGFPVCCGERGSFNGELIYKEACDRDILAVDCHCELYTIPDKVTFTLRYTEEAWKRCVLSGEPQTVVQEGNTGSKVVTDGKITAEYVEAEQQIHITATGISSQASNPQKGDSALTALAEFVIAAKLLGEKEQEVFRMILDINSDHEGTALNVRCEDALSGLTTLVATRLRLVNGHFVIDFISKYPITQNGFPFEKNASEEAEKRNFTLKTTRLSNANYFDPTRKEVQLLTKVSNEVLGRNDEPFVMSGGTYARKLPDAFAFGTGMPLPTPPEGLFLPGHGDYHQPDESISLERIAKALEIYIKGLLQIDREL